MISGMAVMIYMKECTSSSSYTKKKKRISEDSEENKQKKQKKRMNFPTSLAGVNSPEIFFLQM